VAPALDNGLEVIVDVHHYEGTPLGLSLVRAEAERRWAYWDFATDFGAYDLSADRWRTPLAEALGCR
jgi:hypothetical protein